MLTTTPPTVRGLLAEGDLRLLPRLEGEGLDTPIAWVHSSDLTDPTPFFTGDTMLLTTGTQFPADDSDAAYYDAYVERLGAAGVVAIGFGLEVIREGTPAPLVAACDARGVTLVEVPYEVPFIALIRWVADRIAARDRERDSWTLRAQRAVSIAALTTGTLAAVARALAEQVGGAVVVLSYGGDVVLEERVGHVGLDPLIVEGRRMLGRGTRASAEVPVAAWDGFATVQTLGPRGTLRGAIGVAGVGRHDVATQAVVTGAVAIAEVLLGYGDSERRLGQRAGAVILRLLLEGQLPAAAALAAEFDSPLPDPLRVGIAALPAGTGEAARGQIVEALTRDGLSFADDRVDRIVTVSTAGSLDHLQRLVATVPAFDGLTIGLSAALAPAEAPTGFAQAQRMLAQHDEAGLAVFGESTGGLLDELWSPAAENVARKRLAVLLGEPGDLIECSRLWLDHNGHWESAAREAGLHRHTLKARIARVGTLLQLDLDEFSQRAELWALLQASRA
ncbi:PucR family transcriptional regulator [Frondihabitans australicus]|uniref:CdaR family transcriptional regulator n=1 Tax=Frondihabitans australicus TaxID=386892 RepID=A0A495IKV9_9MICO|nr:PucR family transcriptional regulator [Frondihabitans australicus]RKR76617.1 CdaR family transcriptional regulator [Frondihabitans australicus]